MEDDIKLIQAKVGAYPDGIIGRNTIGALLDYLGLRKTATTTTPQGKTVLLFIGHSPTNKGCAGNGWQEYDFVAMMAGKISDQLATQNVTAIILNREINGGGTTPSYSAKAANTYPNAACAVELHLNAYNKVATGTETLYGENRSDSLALAKCLQKEMVNALGLPDRGLLKINSKGNGAGFLLKTKMPSVITEPFFLDNKKDYDIAMAKLDDMTNAIAKGILDFLK